jgi:phosphoglycerate dehydrogenase-like enzyme
VTRQTIESAGNLKVIGRQGVGLDNIDLDAAKEHGIAILSIPETLTESVAEITLALIFSLARDIPRADKGMKERIWLKGKLRQQEIYGKTLGIIGLGKIGMRVAELCSNIGMSVIYWNRTRKPELEQQDKISYVSIDDLFSKANIVSIHVALTPDTERMITARVLSLMKSAR